MQLAATFVVAMLGWYAWFATGRRLWLAGFYLFLAFGALSKGPVAPLLAALVIVGFAAVHRDLRLVWRTLWLPGILIFLVVVLPWFVAVQLRNPEIFRVFFLEHNFARFATNLYRHRQPFWYYVPVLFLGVMPWSALVVAGMVEAGRDWRRRAGETAENALPVFLLIWVAVGVGFFSISMSKLPGYILPVFPPCAMLAANYLRRREQLGWPISVAQAALSAVLLGAALLYPNFLLHRSGAIPSSAKLVAGGIAALLFVATLSGVRRQGTRVLRLVVLAPVIVGLAFLLRVAGPSMDEAFSLRPVAKELDRMGTDRKQLAVFKTSRVVEYGLAFYENRGLARYERGEIPPGDHPVVTTEGARAELQQRVGGRRLSRLGGFPPQRLEYFWVSTPPPGGHLPR
jgi:4-amino-4-deoxy-L-arabinose transferase-like glycosyltransferase